MPERDDRLAAEATAGDEGGADRAGEIVSPEDLPAQIEVTEHDGVTRVDIAEDAGLRPGDADSV